MRSLIIAAGAVLGMSPGVMAEGWTTADLGDTASEASCMVQAELTAERAQSRWGAHSVSAGDWTVALYDIADDDDFDALFICAEGPNGGNRGTLVVYSVGDASSDRREYYTEELKAIWETQ